jgi:hypothetical protein
MSFYFPSKLPKIEGTLDGFTVCSKAKGRTEKFGDSERFILRNTFYHYSLVKSFFFNLFELHRTIKKTKKHIRPVLQETSNVGGRVGL